MTMTSSELVQILKATYYKLSVMEFKKPGNLVLKAGWTPKKEKGE